MEEYKLNKDDINFLKEHFGKDSPHTAHIARVEFQNWFQDLIKEETFEIGKYYRYKEGNKDEFYANFVFKVTALEHNQSHIEGGFGYGIDLDNNKFDKDVNWCLFEDFEYAEEISEDDFLKYIINYLDIQKGDKFKDINGIECVAESKPYINFSDIIILQDEGLRSYIFKDGEIGQKITTKEITSYLWKKTMDLRWIKKGSDTQEEERVLQQKHVEVSTGEVKWENV